MLRQTLPTQSTSLPVSSSRCRPAQTAGGVVVWFGGWLLHQYALEPAAKWNLHVLAVTLPVTPSVRKHCSRNRKRPLPAPSVSIAMRAVSL
jgi:hypothetical protein